MHTQGRLQGGWFSGFELLPRNICPTRKNCDKNTNKKLLMFYRVFGTPPPSEKEIPPCKQNGGWTLRHTSCFFSVPVPDWNDKVNQNLDQKWVRQNFLTLNFCIDFSPRKTDFVHGTFCVLIFLVLVYFSEHTQ